MPDIERNKLVAYRNGLTKDQKELLKHYRKVAKDSLELHKVDLFSGPQIGTGEKMNQVGRDAEGNIIYGKTAYYQNFRSEVSYTGEYYTLVNGNKKTVPAPSDYFKKLTDTQKYNCAGCAFQTFDIIFERAKVIERLKKTCSELPGPNAAAKNGDDTKFYLWTFDVRIWRTNQAGIRIGEGDVKNDFHIVAQDIKTGKIVSKYGDRPLDPRVALMADVFEPGPRDFGASERRMEAIEHLELQVYSGKLADVKNYRP
jgi:hypothetical protein